MSGVYRSLLNIGLVSNAIGGGETTKALRPPSHAICSGRGEGGDKTKENSFLPSEREDRRVLTTRGGCQGYIDIFFEVFCVVRYFVFFVFILFFFS